MRECLAILFGLVSLAACGAEDRSDQAVQSRQPVPCRTLVHEGDGYTVCTFDAATHDIRLFHSDADGVPYLQFDTLERELDEKGQVLVFAMNGGMYHEDRRPVGYYRDAFGDQASVNTNDGPGNFHLKPNGVFWLSDSRAGITESEAYLEQGIDPDYATQSGPMMVIDGALHPSLNPEGTSHRRRNGVGVAADGQTIYFAISDSAVTFYEFATLFRDVIAAPNALFLDGQVSRIYAPSINRNEIGTDLGPIIGVVE